MRVGRCRFFRLNGRCVVVFVFSYNKGIYSCKETHSIYGKMDDGKGAEKPPNPRAKANPLSAVTFIWTLGIFKKGHKRDLEVTDLYSPLKEHSSSYLGDKISKSWEEELQRAQKLKRDPSLLRVIMRNFGPAIMSYGLILGILENVLKVLQPIFLGRLIEFFSDGSKVSTEDAYLFAAGVVVCSGITVFVIHPYMMAILHIGMKIRVACCSLIYRKALRLSKTALGQTTVGQVVNLLSNDVNRFDICVIFLHYLWIGPLQTIVVTYFLWTWIGVSSVLGVAALLVFIPIQAWLGKRTSSLRLRTAIRTDERVRLMNEIISGIQVIKMYTWEKPFAKLVSFARRKEIKEIRGASYIRGILLSFIIFHGRLAIFCSIIAYVLFGNLITAEKVFVVTSYYNILRQTMTVFFPQGIGQVAEGLVSVKRLQAFLNYEETMVQDKPVDKEDKKDNKEDKDKFDGKVNGVASNNTDVHKPQNKDTMSVLQNSEGYVQEQSGGEKGIVIKSAYTKWIPDVSEDTLSNINLTVTPGKLTVIIGPVGAGKSSLLHAILGELPLREGSIKVNGIISYASQEPWLFAGSVRQNILFGSPYDKDRYRQVVKVCALRTDFEQLPYGDKTTVGERGVSLSGGQRARINLARAVYKQADVYLLDDPLSAVDTHVGKHLFEDCIQGYLFHKTVILVTHQLQYLNTVDHIVLMQNGSIQAEGTYQEVQETAQDFANLLLSGRPDEEMKEENPKLHRRQSSVQSVASSVEEKGQEEPPEVAEMRSSGTVGSHVYMGYLRAGGNCCSMFFMFFMCVFTQLLASGSDYWLTYWVNLEEYRGKIHPMPTAQAYVQFLSNGTNSTQANGGNSVSSSSGFPFYLSTDMCIYIFSGLTVGTVLVTLFRSYLFFFMCMRASMRLHDRMFDSITRATMRFFNTNSSGRILNRFSKDMGAIDEMLPGALIDCLQIGLTLLGIIVVVALVNHWLMIPTVVVAVIFYYLRSFYLSTSRSVKRLEGVTRSPVFAHLNASLQGLTTIRAFHAQPILEKEFDNHQDLHSSAWYIFIASSRAFGYWLDIVCLIYIAIVAFSFLVMEQNTFGGNVGLAITQAIGLTGMFQWGMRQSAELENQMTSVERVLEYSHVEKEPPLESEPDKKPPDTWPEEGRVIFSRVYMAYSPNDPPVLKNLSFTIEPKQKVGIVGRTGAGKSSLIIALFRLVEIQGDIIIDNMLTRNIGLHDLRSKISIIPQEPVLFSGTVRKNLDPFDEYPDHVLWNALEEVELKEIVNDLAGGLNGKMSEGGSNFSVGQRQLLCLARAIVRNNKLLVMDEATANVDPQTDALIQTTIRKKFADCTVLTIAHRLHTVMDSDKVLVMGGGTLLEFDHPHVLLQNKDGVLYSMVEQTGRVSAEALHSIAANAYRRARESETSPPLESSRL